MTHDRLSALQSQFREYLWTGRGEGALAVQVQSRGIDPYRRLDVYRSAYFTRLEEALAHDFPATCTAMGKKAFARVAGDYVLNHPSTSPTLRDLGRHYPRWLREHCGPEPGDLAEIEWALLEAFDGPDANPVGAEVMVGFDANDWPHLAISCLPTLTLLRLESNAYQFWLPAKRDEAMTLESTASNYLAVWRSAKEPSLRVISGDSYHVMKAIHTQPHLAAVCDDLCDSLEAEDVPRVVATIIGEALDLGWIRSVTKTGGRFHNNR